MAKRTRLLISRRSLLRSAAATAAFTAAAPAFAQSAWPDRNIKLIVPYPAGGSTDVLFRILAEKLKDKLGQSCRGREPARRIRQHRHRHGREKRAGRLHDRRARPSGISRSTSILIAQHALQFREGHRRADADLRTAERRRGRGQPRSGQDAGGVHRLGQGAAERHLHRQPGSRHHAASVRRAVLRRAPASTRCTCRSAARRRPFRRCWPATSPSRSTISRPTSRRSNPARCARSRSPRRSAGRRCRTCRPWRKPA